MSVKIEMEGLNQRLKKMRRNASNPRPLMGKVSIFMFKDVFDHFIKEMGPNRAWEALSSVTIKKRRKGKRGGKIRILRDKGPLINSIKPGNTKTAAIVATKKKYARIHNEGGIAGNGVRIPQRKFMWASEKLLKRLIKSVGQFYIGESV